MPAQLAGKRVFVALSPSNEVYKDLKNVLSQCTWSEFLDKHVDVVIMDQRNIRDRHCLPVGANVSRVSRMIKETAGKTRSGSSSVKEIAKKWNIPIHDYRSVLLGSHSNQKEIQECHSKAGKVRRLKAPFVKVEDRSQRYKPCFAEMKTCPFVDFRVPAPKSPFETWYKQNATVNSQGIPPLRMCELCHGTYSDLDSHLTSSKHKAAANDDSLFERVDQLIARGTSLDEFVKKVKNRKTV